jgi:NADH-quinone oxidoreductase subunit C
MAAEPPHQALQELGDYVAAQLPGDVTRHEISRGELAIWTTAKGIVRTLRFLRDDSNCLFKMLVDVCGVDYPERGERFELVYHLLSLRHNHRLRVKLSAGEDNPVPSVAEIFHAAGWYEREVWDLYGVFFSDHPDLRRILTDYGFEGHPLRKDFPLTGYVEVRYDDREKRVVYEPVRLTQEFRSFDFLSPWEGVARQLPGDEKAEGQGK